MLITKEDLYKRINIEFQFNQNYKKDPSQAIRLR